MNPFATALLGFLLGYILSQVNAFTDRRRRRISVATAMLAELDALELVLRQVEEFRHTSPFLEFFPRMDLVEKTANYVDILPPATVRALLTLNIVLNATRRNLQDLDKGHALLDQSKLTEAQQLRALDQHEQVIQHTAIGLLERTASVRQMLIASGAQWIELPALSTDRTLTLP